MARAVGGVLAGTKTHAVDGASVVLDTKGVGTHLLLGDLGHVHLVEFVYLRHAVQRRRTLGNGREGVGGEEGNGRRRGSFGGGKDCVSREVDDGFPRFGVCVIGECVIVVNGGEVGGAIAMRGHVQKTMSAWYRLLRDLQQLGRGVRRKVDVLAEIEGDEGGWWEASDEHAVYGGVDGREEKAGNGEYLGGKQDGNGRCRASDDFLTEEARFAQQLGVLLQQRQAGRKDRQGVDGESVGLLLLTTPFNDPPGRTPGE